MANPFAALMEGMAKAKAKGKPALSKEGDEKAPAFPFKKKPVKKKGK